MRFSNVRARQVPSCRPLCYLEAVRSKVPEILRDEKLGVRAYFMPESAILPATEAELQMDRNLSNLEGSVPSMTSDELLKTVRLADEDTDIVSDHCETSSMAPEPTTSPLPSPLLCPRRTFLACLKFSQDKCYLNRAWEKLSGLPPREIGRCKRALGHALDWRLWVDKKALTAAPLALSCAIVRTQSESSITILPSLRKLKLLRPSVQSTSLPSTIRVPRFSFQVSTGWRRWITPPAAEIFVHEILKYLHCPLLPASFSSSRGLFVLYYFHGQSC